MSELYDDDAWAVMKDPQPPAPETCYRCGKKPRIGMSSRVEHGMRVCNYCECPKLNTP